VTGGRAGACLLALACSMEGGLAEAAGDRPDWDLRLTRAMVVATDTPLHLVATGLSWQPGLSLGPAALAFRSGWRQTGETLASELAAAGLAMALKPVIGWPRPAVLDPTLGTVDPSDPYGLPSGHASVAFAAAGALALGGSEWAPAAWIWAGSVAWSRLALGQHGPTDVIAGALLGVTTAWAVHQASTTWLR